MKPFILVPRKAKNGALQEIIQGFISKCEEIYEKEYHKLSFLSNNRYEELWRERLLQSYSVGFIVKSAVTVLSQPWSWKSQLDLEERLIYELGHRRSFNYIPGVLSSVTSIPASQENVAVWLAAALWKSFHEKNYFDVRNRYNRCCKVFPESLRMQTLFFRVP